MFKGILLLINGLDSVAGSAADVAATQQEVTTEKIQLLDLVQQGGWIMIILAVLLTLCIYIFIERYVTLNRVIKADSSQFMNNIRGYIHSGDVEGARALAKSTDSSIARMIDKGLSRLGRPLGDIQTVVENSGKLEVSSLEKRVSLIATVASLGPMIGFLGTVTGMIKAFFDMAHAGNNIDIELLAGGIYEAMVTTVGGLIVGIIAYFLYNLVVSKINSVVFVLEARTMEFMDLLNEPAD